MAKHTPGPWHFLDIGEVVPSDDDGLPHEELRICFMATPGDDPGAADRIEANGHLIAAAPGLYDMLIKCRKQFEHYQRQHASKDIAEAIIHGEFAAMCDAAIAKARGEQS